MPLLWCCFVQIPFIWWYKFANMSTERRHVCAYCGKKRIERRMITVQFFSSDSVFSGNVWACWFQSYSQTNKDCAARYYDQRAADFYAAGDKMKSAANKLRRYNKV